jgi:alpha-D-ribose 1-methylphosphonate 5-triphosphate synthase subunit PhnG
LQQSLAGSSASTAVQQKQYSRAFLVAALVQQSSRSSTAEALQQSLSERERETETERERERERERMQKLCGE